MRIFVLTATYELRVSGKNHLRDHPTARPNKKMFQDMADALFELIYQQRHLWEEKTNTDCVSKLAV
jgi:hypothetical protein